MPKWGPWTICCDRHSDPVVLSCYLALAGEDVERAHAAHSPVDKLVR